MLRVSVVIPTYNRANLISEAIQSILDQTFQDYEIIIVDDGSTDNTKEIVQNFKNSRLRYICQRNSGVSVAQNTGTKLASGEYIAFLGSDDMLMRDALKKAVDILDAHPEVAFSYGQAYHMDEYGRILSLFTPTCKHSCIRDGRDEIKELMFCTHISAATIRRSCFDEIGGFNPAFGVSEDLEMWIRLAKKWPVAYIAEPLIKYRVHANSIMRRINVHELERNKKLVLEVIFNDKNIGPLFYYLRNKAYSNLYLELADTAYSRREMKKARNYLFQAIKTYPGGLANVRTLPRLLIRFATSWIPAPILNLGHRSKKYFKRMMSVKVLTLKLTYNLRS
jgi:glycosyltransferase involved in cell wall biosynthesis